MVGGGLLLVSGCASSTIGSATNRPAVPSDPAVASSAVTASLIPTPFHPASSPLIVPESSIAPIVATCAEKDLSIANPDGQVAGMGGVTVAIVFTNTGTQPCSLKGWPTITTPGLVTKVQYRTTTGAGFVVPVTTVTLQPGKQAASALDLFAAEGNTYGSCSRAGSWSVAPPGADQPTTVAWHVDQGPCSDGAVLVSPIYLGALPEVGFGSLDPRSVPPAVASSPGPQIAPASTPPSVIVGPACKASQLSANLEDIEEAGDFNYGWMIIRDISSAVCQLTGTIGIVGLDATGATDTITAHASVASGLFLTANAAPVPNSALPPSDEHVAFMVPGSSDSITTGAGAGYDCPASDEIVPTTFLLSINGTGTISTPNGQASGTPSQLQICQGQLDAGGPITGQPN
jgi:hypothetical protein